MRLTSLVPSRGSNALMRPDFGLFGLHREIDRLFSDLAQGVAGNGAQANIVPNIEISETDKAIEISAEMPGLERKDVDISIEDDTLTIRGEKRVEEKDDKNVQHSERSYGVFLRVLQLPAGIDPSSVQATCGTRIARRGETASASRNRLGVQAACLAWPSLASASLTSIFFGSGFAGFGITILRTPFDIVAWTLDGSMPAGSCNTRRNTP